MLRGVLLLVVLGACAGLGFQRAGADARRLSQLLMLNRTARIISQEIETARTPLPEAFCRAAGRVEEPFTSWLTEMARELGAYDRESFAKVFRDKTRQYLSDTRLTAQDLREWEEAGIMLGYPDIQVQTGALSLYLAENERTAAALREELPARRKLFRSLGVLGGVFLMILFW